MTGETKIPIGPDDVETRGSTWSGRGIMPALNVKVYGSVRDLTPATFADIASESESDGFADMTGEEIRDATITALESMWDRGIYWPDEHAAEQGWSDAAEIAADLFGEIGYNVKTYSNGRSGGWLVVDGLPDPSDPDNWREEDADHDRGPWLDIAPVWATFADRCAELVADIPYNVAWHLLVNAPEEILGRVVDVTLRIVLAGDDIDAGNDPHAWDWREMLDLSRETRIDVKDNRATGNAGKFRPI